jgi:hypothetical protein
LRISDVYPVTPVYLLSILWGGSTPPSNRECRGSQLCGFLQFGIRELERVRELLRNEGERISRDIAGYAGLSQASMAAAKIISDSLKIWKNPERLA